MPATLNRLAPVSSWARCGADVAIRVRIMPQISLVITTPKEPNATGPIDLSPKPPSPKLGLYLNPIRASGRNSISAWKATPKVQVPAVSAILSAVQNSRGCSLALLNSRIKPVKPAQLIMLAPVELHAYVRKWSLAARI